MLSGRNSTEEAVPSDGGNGSAMGQCWFSASCTCQWHGASVQKKRWYHQNTCILNQLFNLGRVGPAELFLYCTFIIL